MDWKWLRLSFWKQMSYFRLFFYLLGCLFILWLSVAIYEAFRLEQLYCKELQYFSKLEEQRKASRRAKYGSQTVQDENSTLVQPVFDHIVQLRSWDWKKSLRLGDDYTCEYPPENVWIYVAGRETCPKSDGIDMCEDYIAAFDQFIHTSTASRGVVLAFVDCDVSELLCIEWGVEANVMVHYKSKSSCEFHFPEENDSEFRWTCPMTLQGYPLPLKRMPTRSLNKFPSAYEQLYSLIRVRGFEDEMNSFPCI